MSINGYDRPLMNELEAIELGDVVIHQDCRTENRRQRYVVQNSQVEIENVLVDMKNAGSGNAYIDIARFMMDAPLNFPQLSVDDKKRYVHKYLESVYTVINDITGSDYRVDKAILETEFIKYKAAEYALSKSIGAQLNSKKCKNQNDTNTMQLMNQTTSEKGVREITNKMNLITEVRHTDSIHYLIPNLGLD